MKIFYLQVLCKILLMLCFCAFFEKASSLNHNGRAKVLRLAAQADTAKHKPKDKDLLKDKELSTDKDSPKGKANPEDGIDENIRGRELQEAARLKDPALNIVPVERIIHARQIKDQLIQQPHKFNSLNSFGNISQSLNTVDNMQWAERGPTNVGGRTRALMFDLSDAANGYKKVFAGGVGGGLWVTTDITATPVVWNKINDFFENIAISCIAQNPVNPKEIYAGTGEGWDNGDAIQGLGVWKTTDGGVTWTRLVSTAPFTFINSILVDKNGNAYVAGLNFGIQKSTDGGATWNQVIASPQNGADLQLAANGDVYASTGAAFGVGNIFISDFAANGATTGDAGTWVNITPETTGVVTPSTPSWNRIKLACAPGNANVLYALIQGVNSVNLTSVQRYSKTDNAWTVKAVPNGSSFSNGQAWYSIAAAVDPNNENVLFAGSLDAVESTDGGTTWTPISQWTSGELPGLSDAQYVHADHHAYVFAPGSSNRLLMGTDGGVFYTINANAPAGALPVFASKDNTYNVTQFYSVTLHPTSNNYALGGTQDNGTQQFTAAGLSATNTASGGDGGYSFIDQVNPNFQITSYTNNNFFLSTDNGATFNFVVQDGSGSFINPADYDSKQKVLYSGSYPGSYFRWDSVTTAGPPKTSGVAVANFNFGNVTSVTVSPIVSNRIYFGLDNGKVVRVDSANTGANNSGTILNPNPSAQASVSCVAIDPRSEDHLLVSYFNYGVISLYETKNATAAAPVWTPVEGNLPDMPVRWAMFYPGDSTRAIIATELGVWTTDLLNGQSTVWNPTNSGLANTRVDMLKFRASDRTLAAATHGRGLFTTILPAPVFTTLLTNLSISSGSLNPAFATKTSSYTVSVGNAVTSVTVRPTSVAGATIKVNGTTVSSGSASPAISLSAGLNTINVVVTSQGGATVNTYSVLVTRLPAPPTISYSSPHTYVAGTPITTLTPTSSGVAVAGYSTTTINLGSGFNRPHGVAVDAAGNVYVADFGNGAVKKIPAGGGSPVILGSGFGSPAGIAVDATGNVYVADAGNNAIVKLIKSGGQISLGSGFNQPAGVAVDAKGNVYVADAGNNAVELIPVGGGPMVNIGSGYNQPTGVAIDAAGTLYVADSGNGAVKMIPFGATVPVTLGSGFNLPSAIAVDGSLNVYVADVNNNAVTKIPAGGGFQVTLAFGYSAPSGIAVDASGKVYVGDTGNGLVKKIVPVGGYYISALPAGLTFNNGNGSISGTPAVSTPAANYTVTAYNSGGSGAATVNLTVSTTANLSMLSTSNGILTPAFVSNITSYTASVSNITKSIQVTPVTGDRNATIKVNGAPVASGTPSQALPLIVGKNTILVVVTAVGGVSKTYTLTVTRLPPAISYNSPQTYIAGTAITPLAPAGSGIAAPAYNTGTVTLGSGFIFPSGVAIDAAGNIYVTDLGNRLLTEIPAAGGASIVLLSGFNLIGGVAVDAAGNVYVADSGTGTVQKKPAGGGASVIVASGFSAPGGIAVDLQGNLYVADSRAATITKIPVNGGSPVILAEGFADPSGVAVDAGGNVYVSDSTAGVVYEIPVADNAVIQLGYIFSFPSGLAVDASGNIYVADGIGAPVKEIPFGGGPVIAIGSGIKFPVGVALDAAGNVYVADQGNSAIKEIIPTGGYYIGPALPQGLVFDNNTGIISGTPAVTSPATNYVVTAYGAAGGSTATVNIRVNPPAPGVPASKLTFTNTTTAGTTVHWTNGNGTANAIFIRLGADGGAAPVNGVTYAANPAFAAGDQIGISGWYCVYDGTGSSVSITGLSPGATYRVTAVEYNAIPGYKAYLTTKQSPANVTTVQVYPTAPALQVNFVNTTTTATTTRWTNGNGQSRAVFMAKRADGGALPADNATYTANGQFGSGSQVGTTGWYCIYRGTGSTVDVSGLTAGTTYRVTVVEFDGTTGVEKYLIAKQSPANVTTTMITPTVPSRLLTFTNTKGTSTDLNWTAGNGSERAAFIKKGSNGAAAPLDNRSFAANPTFGLGDQIGTTGWYCIYNGNGSPTVNISGLTPATTYRVTVVDYNMISGAQKYLVTGLSPSNVTTSLTPTNSLLIPNSANADPMVTSPVNEKVEANNILSPNGDGMNDTWIVKNIAFYPNNTVTVFDREGKVVFSQKGYKNDWAGTYNGSVLDEGTYYYLINLGNGWVVRGFVTVVRDR